jgi:uncharacterized protein YkwD
MRARHRRLFIVLAASLSLTLTLFWLLGAASQPATGLLGLQPQTQAQGSGTVITPSLHLPLVATSDTSLTVNPQDRQASLSFFNSFYRASEGAPVDWSGDHGSCRAGQTASAFRNSMAKRINYFRAMAGVPAAVQLSDEFNAKAQAAALMMSVNRQLSHSPAPTWECYSTEGAEAAGRSNLFLGVYGRNAIDGYMRDAGSGNYFVGHRRWVLYPQTKVMGTGDIPPADGYPASNALWVFDGNTFGPRPDTREQFVAWPPPGYVPYQVVFPRWSFAYAGADFSSASVSVMSNAGSIPVQLQPVVDGYGENTIVWEPQVAFGTPPASDTAYSVLVRDVLVGGNRRDFPYEVIIFDPDSQSIDGPGMASDGQLGVPLRIP